MRWIFRMAVALGVAAVLLLAGLLLLPGEKVAEVALDKVRTLTGREVRLDGEVELTLFPELRVRTGPVTIANADWSDKGPMLKAGALLVGVETWPLLRGQIRIRTLELEAPELLLERARDGRVNWLMDVAGSEVAPAAQGGSATLDLGVDRVALRRGRVSFFDHRTGVTRIFSAVEASMVAGDLRGRADLKLAVIAGKTGAGAPLAITARVDGLMPFLQGAAVPVEASLTASGGRVAFTGRAGITPEAAGVVSATLPDSAGFLAAVGLTDIALPKGLGQSLTGEGKLVLTGGTRLALRELGLQLDHNRLSTDADIDFAPERPRVKARITAGKLDFSQLSEARSAGAVAATPGQGGNAWPGEPIDAGALGLVDAEARLTADAITFSGLTLGQSDIGIALERSRAVFTLSKVAAYGGALGGEFVLNNRSGLSVGGKLAMQGIDTEALLNEAAGITRLSGQASGAVNFLGVGQSVRAIMASLKGAGQVSMGRGRINGFDLDRLMQAGEVTGGTTIFDEMTATFELIGGNLQNSDLKMLLPNVEATGKGRIGIGARDIDYLFTPVALRARGGRGLAVPVRIRGPWDAPKVLPDMRAAIDLNFAEEKKALEDKARAKVQQKLEEQLDIEVQEGQSLEDAVKQKAEQELLKGLQKLLE